MKDNSSPCLFVGAASIMHFLVDGICLCTLYIMAYSFYLEHLFTIFLVYNILAFVSQPFTGIIADKTIKKHWMLIVSVLMLVAAVMGTALEVNSKSLQSFATSISVAVLLGIGNSLFHVWGGKQMVVKKGNDMRTLGVFVSTGAFGLAVSMVFYSWILLYILIISFCLLALLYIYYDKNEKVKPCCDEFDDDKNYSDNKALTFVFTAVTAIAAFVLLRSYIGETFSSGIQKKNLIILALGATAMLGKMAGGWIAKGFGIVKAMAIILPVVIVCYIFKYSGLPVVLSGVFLINTTMPVTLYLANYCMKDKEGLAFGILAAALIPGYLLALI